MSGITQIVGNEDNGTSKTVFVNSSNALKTFSITDDAIVTDDSAVTLGTQKGIALMGFAGTQSVDANDACMLACSTAGRLEVDVTSIVPGTGATNLGKAIQSPQGTTDTGVPALVVRNDTLADLAGTDHDYAPLQVNATGALYTQPQSHHVTATLAAGSATIGKLAANTGVNIGDVDVLSLPLTFNSGNKGATTQRVVIATDDIPIALVNTKLDHLSTDLDDIKGNQGTLDTTIGEVVTNVDAGNSLLTTIDNVLDTIKVDTEAIETAVEILSANQSKTTTQLLYGTGNLVANGTPESSSNSVEMLNNGERVTTFIEAQNTSWDAFNEWSYDNSTWFTDQSLNFSGDQTALYHDFKKGKYLRVKVNNMSGTSGDTNSFVVNIVQ